MPIKISVVIPTYRRPHLLKKCLEALKEQDLDRSHFEILVVSDGYDALTEEVVRQYCSELPLLTYHHLSIKKGPAAARNCGWKEAKGSLIAFTDDDTLPQPEWLSSFVASWDGSALVAFTGQVKVPVSPLPTDYEKNTAGLETADFVTANCCCTRKALEKVHGFDEQFSMAWREDSDLEFKLLVQRIPIVKVPDALIIHPVREAKWGISMKEQKKGMFNALLYKKFPRLYRQKIQKSPPWNYYIIVSSAFGLFICLLAGSKIAAFLFFDCWFLFTAKFIHKRLASTSKSSKHVMEMVVTSLVIPFLSIFWQAYGAIRYRVLFI